MDPLSLLLASISLSIDTFLDTLEMYSDKEIIRVTSAAVKISREQRSIIGLLF
jgi:hypothetical protein